MREAYEIKVKDNKYSLRLTLGGQIALKKKYNKQDIMEVFYEGMDKPEVLADIMTEALNYPDNENGLKDGIELYDRLVDDGYCGQKDFVPLLTSIGKTSGFISDKMKAVIDKMATREDDVDVDEAVEKIDDYLEGKDEKNA